MMNINSYNRHELIAFTYTARTQTLQNKLIYNQFRSWLNLDLLYSILDLVLQEARLLHTEQERPLLQGPDRTVLTAVHCCLVPRDDGTSHPPPLTRDRWVMHRCH